MTNDECPKNDHDRMTKDDRWPPHLLVLLLLLLVPAMITLREADASVQDADIWYHMKAGEWIVEHREAIGVDPFSRYGQEHQVEWIAYSWLFEVVLHVLYQAFGLAGFPLYTLVMMVLITWALYGLLRGRSADWMLVGGLTLIGYFGMRHLDAPRPWLLTILCFILELRILLAARQPGRLRLLSLLPPLFVLWANVHIQYLFGLVVLGAALAESVIQRVLPLPSPPHDGRSVPLGPMLASAAACFLATFVNPYGYRIYEPAMGFLEQGELWGTVNELLAPTFRQPSDWILLGVTVSAAFAIGYRRRCSLFLLFLYVGGAYLSFRSARDSWFALITGLCILAAKSGAGSMSTTVASPSADETPALAGEWPGLVVAAVLIGLMSYWKLDQASLPEAVTAVFPEEAAAYIEKHKLPGPIFNHYNWGGYLIWRLPSHPTNMDGRSLVHGTERILRHIETFRGKEWKSDRDLLAAGVLVLMKDSTLAALLREDSRFEPVNEDAVAVVFVRKR